MRDTTTAMKIVGTAIVIVQLIDIALHATTQQLESLRVASNLGILLWLAIMASGRFKEKSLLMAVVAIGAYLILNSVFLALEGVTAEGGGVRITLFALMFLTVTLSCWLTYLREKSIQIGA